MLHGLPIRPGEILNGTFRVEGVVGIGEDAVVLRAAHLQLGRPVALKLLRGDKLQDARLSSRLETSARAMQAVRHPHVVDVLGFERLRSGHPFVVMELLAGRSLEKRLEEESPTLAVSEAVEIVRQVCEALAAAHEKGVVHGGIDTNQIFLTSTGDGRPHVKVTDFCMTEGSPFFLWPEYFTENDRGMRGDLWGAAVLLYVALTGEYPFMAESLPELCTALVQEPHVPVHELRPDVPGWLSAFVDRCLAKAWPARIPSAYAMSTELHWGLTPRWGA